MFVDGRMKVLVVPKLGTSSFGLAGGTNLALATGLLFLKLFNRRQKNSNPHCAIRGVQ